MLLRILRLSLNQKRRIYLDCANWTIFLGGTFSMFCFKSWHEWLPDTCVIADGMFPTFKKFINIELSLHCLDLKLLSSGLTTAIIPFSGS